MYHIFVMVNEQEKPLRAIYTLSKSFLIPQNLGDTVMFATWLFAVTKKIRLTLNNKRPLPIANTTPRHLTYHLSAQQLLQRTL